MVNKITKTRYSYLEPFLTSREQLHLLDISRKIEENHTTVRKYLNDFEKLGLLKRVNKGRLTMYEINFDFSLWIDFIVVAEKDKLIRRCIENLLFKELVSELHKLTNKALIIFGSASDDFKEAGDIDIISLDKKLSVKAIEKKFDLDIHLHYVSSLKKISKTMKREILKKHLIINGSEDIVKWLV